MRFLYLPILVIFLFNSNYVFAQYSPEHELDSIHQPIYHRLDSIYTLKELISIQLDTTTLPSIRKDQHYKLNALDSAIENNWKERLLAEFAFVKSHLSQPISINILEFDLIRPEGS